MLFWFFFFSLVIYQHNTGLPLDFRDFYCALMILGLGYVAYELITNVLEVYEKRRRFKEKLNMREVK